MGQPVKLSEGLVTDARLVGGTLQRSIAGQIEFWARLGRAIEPLLERQKVVALAQAGAARPLSECIESADSAEGRERLAEYLKSQPYPHYEPAPDSSGLLIRIDADGKRTLGRFVHRKFQAAKVAKKH